MEPLGPIVRVRGDAITGASRRSPEQDRPELPAHQRKMSWDSSTSYDGSCSVSIRSDGTFHQRRSSAMGSEQQGRGSRSSTSLHRSLSTHIISPSSAPDSARSTVSTSAASVITASTTRSRSFSIDSRSVYSLSEADEPPTPTLRARRRLRDSGAESSTQDGISRSRVSMDAARPADDFDAHTPRADTWKSLSHTSLAMSTAGESSKRRGRVSFGPMENYDWSTVARDDVFASSSRLGAASPPPRPARRRSVPSLGYGLAQQYCRPESETEATDHDDDWEERAQRTPTALADSTLRSAPGVRGIGEGWAGGPQLSKTSWWKRRKRETQNDDPLALWDTAGNVKADTASPVKSLWNRSVQAFGGSMPHLPLERRRTTKRDKEKRPSDGTITEDEEQEPTPHRSMRSLFSRSTTSLASAEKLPKVRDRIPTSYSTSHLVSAPTTTAGRIIPRSPVKQRTSFIDADADLAATPTMSSPNSRRMSGPRPPWRPQSYMSVSKPLNEADGEEDGLATPMMDRDGSGGTITSDSSAARTDRSIQRSSTFGAGEETARMDASPSAEAEPEMPGTYRPVRDDYWTNRRDELRDSTVGLDTIAQWSTEPKERMELPSRRTSIFRKIQQALGTPRSVSMRRSDTPSPLKLFSRATTPAFGRSTPAAPENSSTSPTPMQRAETPASPVRTMADPAYLIMHEAVKEALDTPPRAPQRSQTVRHRRRGSWMSQGDGWMKRLSMLMEQDEDDRDRASTASPISCISPREPTPDGVQQAKRQSRFTPAAPRRTSSLRRPEMTSSRGSTSTPALTRLTTTDLDLRLVLPDAGLGLDDILVDSKRQSIIEMLDLDIASTFSFPAPPARSPMMPSLTRNSSAVSAHTRNVSEPVSSLTPTKDRPWSHVRNASEPADAVPLLEESRSIPHSTTSASSSTFPETPHMTRADLYARRSRDHELSHKSSATSTTSWTDTSFYSAKEPAVEEVSLYKALSRLSDVSELGAVVEAVRMPPMGGTRKANMVTIEELRNSPMSTRPSTPVV